VRSLETARRSVAKRGPYRVASCANDTYRVERVAVHCKRHKRPPARRYCEGCAIAGQGVGSRLQLAADIAAVLNVRRR
jgi:hypothetical protein